MNHTKDLLLSLDLGTTAIKVGLFSLRGELLRIESREQRLIFPQPGRSEQSPTHTWELIANAVRTILDGYNRDAVVAIAVSVQRGTVVPLDEQGNPLSNLIVWMDARGVPYAEWVKSSIGLAAYRSIAGSSPSYISGASKQLWLSREAEQIWSKVHVVGTPQTLFLKWLGSDEFVCDLSSGSSHFPLDIEKKIWSQELASRMHYPIERLPKLVTAVQVVGGLSEKAAEALGLNPGVALVAGGGDGQCAGAGSGVLEPGLCMINVGTGTGVQVYLQEPKRDPDQILSCSGHVDPDAWEMEGHTQASGVAFRWFRDQFGQVERNLESQLEVDAFDLLVEQAMGVKPGAQGLLFVPTFNGCTAPVPDPNMRGSFIGLRLDHNRNHLIRAVLEGISLEIRWMLEAIQDTGVPIHEVRLVGGGSRNQHWNQIHADILGRRVTTTKVKDTALVGCAMCAAVALGGYKNLQEAVRNFVQLEDTIEPDETNFDIYQKAFENYRKTFTILSESAIFIDLRDQIL